MRSTDDYLYYCDGRPRPRQQLERLFRYPVFPRSPLSRRCYHVACALCNPVHAAPPLPMPGAA